MLKNLVLAFLPTNQTDLRPEEGDLKYFGPIIFQPHRYFGTQEVYQNIPLVAADVASNVVTVDVVVVEVEVEILAVVVVGLKDDFIVVVAVQVEVEVVDVAVVASVLLLLLVLLLPQQQLSLQ